MSWNTRMLGIALGARNVQPNGRQSRGRPAQKRRRKYRRDERPANIEPYDPKETPPTKLVEGDGVPDILWRVVVDSKFRPTTPLVALIEARSMGEASIKMREFMTVGDSIQSIQEAKV